MHTFRRVVFVVAGALALATVPATGAFADPPLACGTTLIASVRLSADLECRGGTALYVGADTITIDLAGHYIKGDGTGTGIAGAGSTRYRDVVVKGGTITNFEYGVYLTGAYHPMFDSVTFLRGTVGVRLQFCEDGLFAGVNFRDTTVELRHSLRTIFDPVTAVRSSLRLSESNSTRLAGSTLTDSLLDGWESDLASVMHNTFTRSPIVIRTVSRDWLVQENLIQGATEGVFVDARTFDVPRAHLIANTIIGNQIGILVVAANLHQVDGLAISGNTLSDNTTAGLLFDTLDLGAVATASVTKNLFARNGWHPTGRTDSRGRPVLDGAYFATAVRSSIKVGYNTAADNARYGIYADPGGVVDAGGNRSIRDPLGCLGVVCTP